MTACLEEKSKALELLMNEHQSLKEQLEATTLRASNAEAENKMLIDRWMLQKMKDAERLNDVLLSYYCGLNYYYHYSLSLNMINSQYFAC